MAELVVCLMLEADCSSDEILPCTESSFAKISCKGSDYEEEEDIWTFQPEDSNVVESVPSKKSSNSLEKIPPFTLLGFHFFR